MCNGALQKMFKILQILFTNYITLKHSTTVMTLLKKTGNRSCADIYRTSRRRWSLADLKLRRGMYLVVIGRTNMKRLIHLNIKKVCKQCPNMRQVFPGPGGITYPDIRPV